MNTKPYVVSGDIYLLMQKWALKNSLKLPKYSFFVDLRKQFSTYMESLFPCFEFIDEQEISKYLAQKVLQSGLPCISLDQVYHSGDHSIDLTRVVDSNGNDQGLCHRFGSSPLGVQLKKIKESGITEACLVDDVIFSGELIEKIVGQLQAIGISIPIVCAGIGIQQGLDRIAQSRQVDCFRIYDEVTDEVCERDFYLGVPFSGRSHAETHMSSPYMLPYGKPDLWASIPISQQEPFSRFCIEQTINLFEEIEKSSNRIICCSEIERKVPTQPGKGSYVDFLKRIRVQ